MGQKSSVKASEDADMVILGRIGAPFGVKGWVHVFSYAEPSDSILSYKTWSVRLQGTSQGSSGSTWQTLAVLESRAQGKSFVARLKGLETRDIAARYTHAEIGVPRSNLPALEPDEYYWTDLIGLTVLNEDDQELGQVTGLLETGSNDVLVVKGAEQASKEHLIPYIPGDYVLEVNLEAGILRVSWDPEF